MHKALVAPCLYRRKAEVRTSRASATIQNMVCVVHTLVSRRLLDFEVSRGLREDHLERMEAEDVNCVGADYEGERRGPRSSAEGFVCVAKRGRALVVLGALVMSSRWSASAACDRRGGRTRWSHLPGEAR